MRYDRDLNTTYVIKCGEQYIKNDRTHEVNKRWTRDIMKAQHYTAKQRYYAAKTAKQYGGFLKRV